MLTCTPKHAGARCKVYCNNTNTVTTLILYILWDNSTVLVHRIRNKWMTYCQDNQNNCRTSENEVVVQVNVHIKSLVVHFPYSYQTCWAINVKSSLSWTTKNILGQPKEIVWLSNGQPDKINVLLIRTLLLCTYIQNICVGKELPFDVICAHTFETSSIWFL